MMYYICIRFYFQLAVLIRNLSFEEENAEILSSNMLVFRYVFFIEICGIIMLTVG